MADKTKKAPKKHQVLQSLKEVEDNNDVTTLFAVLRGSRLSGLNGPDSDVDVQFIYAHSPEKYQRVQPGLHEPCIEKYKGAVDMQGWSIQKAVRLMSSSNTRLLECLVAAQKHPGVMYVDTLAMNPIWSSYPRFFNPYRVYRSYVGMIDSKLAGDCGPKDLTQIIPLVVRTYYMNLFGDQNGLVINIQEAADKLIKDAIGEETVWYVNSLPKDREKISRDAQQEIKEAARNITTNPKNVPDVETPGEEEVNKIFRKTLSLI